MIRLCVAIDRKSLQLKRRIGFGKGQRDNTNSPPTPKRLMILDFCFSYADENAQIDNERMRWQTEGSVKKFLSEVSLQRIWRQFCENNVDYYISKEVVMWSLAVK